MASRQNKATRKGGPLQKPKTQRARRSGEGVVSRLKERQRNMDRQIEEMSR